jgi:hypothetical protein
MGINNSKSNAAPLSTFSNSVIQSLISKLVASVVLLVFDFQNLSFQYFYRPKFSQFIAFVFLSLFDSLNLRLQYFKRSSFPMFIASVYLTAFNFQTLLPQYFCEL